MILGHRLRHINYNKGWSLTNATYVGEFYDSTLSGIDAILFNPTGTTVYYSLGSYTVVKRTLSTAWDITSAGSASNTALLYTMVTIQDMKWGDSGNKLFIVDTNTDSIQSYNLATPYTIAASDHDGGAADSSYNGLIANPCTIALSTNGTRAFVSSSTNSLGYVYQYNLGTAWDLSTTSNPTKSKNFSLTYAIEGLYINPGSNKLFMLARTHDTVYQSILSDISDITTANAVTSQADLDYSSYGTTGDGIFIDESGARLYIGVKTGSKILQYSLG